MADESKREKSNSNVTENIQWKLDSTLILLEGIGKRDDGTVAHNALGLYHSIPLIKNLNSVPTWQQDWKLQQALRSLSQIKI